MKYQAGTHSFQSILEAVTLRCGDPFDVWKYRASKILGLKESRIHGFYYDPRVKVKPHEERIIDSLLKQAAGKSEQLERELRLLREKQEKLSHELQQAAESIRRPH